MSEAVTAPTPGPPRLYRSGLTMLRGMSEGALWGTAAGLLVGAFFVMALVGPFLFTDPLLAVFLFLPGVVMGGGFGVVYGAVVGIACGTVLRFGVMRHRRRKTPYTVDGQKVLGGITGTLAAGLTGLALYVLDLDVVPLTTTGQGALWILILVPAVAAGATMALRAPAIVNAGYVTTPPTGRPTSGPTSLAEPPAA